MGPLKKQREQFSRIYDFKMSIVLFFLRKSFAISLFQNIQNIRAR